MVGNFGNGDTLLYQVACQCIVALAGSYNTMKWITYLPMRVDAPIANGFEYAIPGIYFGLSGYSGAIIDTGIRQ
jgi:hypothetical protein